MSSAHNQQTMAKMNKQIQSLSQFHHMHHIYDSPPQLPMHSLQCPMPP